MQTRLVWFMSVLGVGAFFALVVSAVVPFAGAHGTSKPSVPILQEPASGASTKDSTPEFSWAASTDPDGDSITYHFQVSAESSFDINRISEKDLVPTSFTPESALADGLWYWRVRAEDEHNKKSAYATAFTVMVDTVPPTTPTVRVTSPVNAATQTVTGTAEANARITITGGAALVSQQLSGDGTSFSVSVPLTQDAINALVVTAADAAGNTSAPGSASIVEDSTAPALPVASPAGGIYSGTQTVALSAEAGATIRYTTDGTTPSGASPAYVAPLSLATTTTVRAIATDAAGNTSSVLTETYTLALPASGSAPSVAAAASNDSSGSPAEAADTPAPKPLPRVQGKQLLAPRPASPSKRSVASLRSPSSSPLPSVARRRRVAAPLRARARASPFRVLPALRRGAPGAPRSIPHVASSRSTRLPEHPTAAAVPRSQPTLGARAGGFGSSLVNFFLRLVGGEAL